MSIAPAKRIFIVAGEHSGDLLGAKLMTALKSRLGDGSVFAGVGGHDMEQAGLKPIFPLSDIAVMGVLAIAKRLPTLITRVYDTVDAAVEFEPDCLIIIDAPEFTHPVAKRFRAQRPDVPIIDYVSPTVWAWRPGRARKMAPYVDLLLALYPFEPAAHKALGGPECVYVGHPVLERLAQIDAIDPSLLQTEFGLRSGEPILLVLPGSRRTEVERLMGVFGETVARVAAVTPGLKVILPAMPNVQALIEQQAARWPAAAPRPLIFPGKDEQRKFAAFKLARAALAASGTVTLELSLTLTPMVVAYRVDIVISVLRHLIKAKSVVLPNLITGEFHVREYLQEDCTAPKLTSAVLDLMTESPVRQRQLDEMRRVPEALKLPDGLSASEAAAGAVIPYIGQGRKRAWRGAVE